MEMIVWVAAGFWFAVTMVLSRRIVKLEEDLRAERSLCEQAWGREEQLEARIRRIIEINHTLAQCRPMYFAGQPTLDATAYRAEAQPLIVWWTYDN